MRMNGGPEFPVSSLRQRLAQEAMVAKGMPKAVEGNVKASLLN